ncbi:MAG: 16S rRNA (cytosine(1402)-N(4))-methyltransferase RsmH [Candidatus Shapirobacteria bacterium]|nr:16S rRNA (cytosine(1402)-N(4))-methyltransferase RsmH [Candidatus Shapirobacteria bacterium]
MNFHQPVLLKKTIEFLGVEPGKLFIDATLGGGGHAQEIIKSGGLVVGIDQDPEALVRAQQNLRSACPAALCSKQRAAIDQAPGFNQQPFKLIEDNFVNLEKIVLKLGLKTIDGILFDLGTSHYQLTQKNRGFSFDSDCLDMRMSPQLKVTAADLLAALSENELYQIFTKFSQEGRARVIARAIIRARQIAPITSGKKLAKVIEEVSGFKKGRIHPATKVFQALRIVINDELNNLSRGLEQAKKLLTKKGRLVVISFHEGEDRIVKTFFKEQAQEKKLTIITKKPIVPDQEEVKTNPSSRSAKLRVAQKN